MSRYSGYPRRQLARNSCQLHYWFNTPHVIVVMVLDAFELTADTITRQVKIKSLLVAISVEITKIRLQIIPSVIISHASNVQVQNSGSSVLHVSSSVYKRVLVASSRLNVHVLLRKRGCRNNNKRMRKEVDSGGIFT